VALLASVLRMATVRGHQLYTIPGRPPDLTAQIPGCPFAPRCDAASDRCRTEMPPVETDGAQQWRCFHPAAITSPAQNAPEVSR
jgi:oligopeptide/dipeptide ABC transporter ATP-binding protein